MKDVVKKMCVAPAEGSQPFVHGDEMYKYEVDKTSAVSRSE